MVVVAVVTVTFIIIGDINKLAPIVTMPFLITYASIDYSYFALAQTFDLQHKREMRYGSIILFNFNCTYYLLFLQSLDHAYIFIHFIK